MFTKLYECALIFQKNFNVKLHINTKCFGETLALIIIEHKCNCTCINNSKIDYETELRRLLGKHHNRMSKCSSKHFFRGLQAEAIP